MPWRRFDFPSAWGGLLSELAAAAAWDAPSAVPAKHRALGALKTVVHALSERPGGVIVPAGRPLLHQGEPLCCCRRLRVHHGMPCTDTCKVMLMCGHAQNSWQGSAHKHTFV